MKQRFTCTFTLTIISLLFVCACSSNEKTQTYDGREFDISVKQDKSLIAKSTKEGFEYNLTISGSGQAVDYSKKELVPWNPIIKKIKNVTINEGILNIGDYYFYSLPIEYLILPSTVNSVGEHSFNNNTTIYTMGGELVTSNDVYYYSETKPTQAGNYFFLEDGVPHIWQTPSILFIGNSFTYYTATEGSPMVPSYFSKIAKNLGQDNIIDSVCKGSHKLTLFADPSDEYGKVVEQKLTTNKYDYVILQEHSTTPISNYDIFLAAVTKLKTRIDATQTNCKTILYETWGSPASYQGQGFDSVGAMELALRNAYSKAAKETGCEVTNVGQAFTYAYETLNLSNIYYTDNRHQSSFGAYLSAACHVKSIFKFNMSKCSEYCELDEEECKTLLGIADTIC